MFDKQCLIVWAGPLVISNLTLDVLICAWSDLSSSTCLTKCVGILIPLPCSDTKPSEFSYRYFDLSIAEQKVIALLYGWKVMYSIHDKNIYKQIYMVLKNALRSRNGKVKGEESLRLYDLESYSKILMSSIAQWKRRWLSGHAIQDWIRSIVVCHLRKIYPSIRHSWQIHV